MKKLIILLIISAIAIFAGISGQDYVNDAVKHELYIPNNATIDTSITDDIIEAGPFKIVRVSGDSYRRLKAECPNIYGESITYHGDSVSLDNIMREIGVAIYDDIDDGNTRIIHGYSARCGNAIAHHGRMVNIEAKCGNNTIQIGTPLIMGSY